MRKTNRKIPLYTGNLVIIQLDDKEDMNEVARAYDIKHDMSGNDGMAFIEKQNFIIAFSKNTNPSIIAHESLHAVSYIFDFHCILMDCKNDEPVAYLLEWIVAECHKFLVLEKPQSGGKTPKDA